MQRKGGGGLESGHTRKGVEHVLARFSSAQPPKAAKPPDLRVGGAASQKTTASSSQVSSIPSTATLPSCTREYSTRARLSPKQPPRRYVIRVRLCHDRCNSVCRSSHRVNSSGSVSHDDTEIASSARPKFVCCSTSTARARSSARNRYSKDIGPLLSVCQGKAEGRPREGLFTFVIPTRKKKGGSGCNAPVKCGPSHDALTMPSRKSCRTLSSSFSEKS